jgi:hypothetical protein
MLSSHFIPSAENYMVSNKNCVQIYYRIPATRPGHFSSSRSSSSSSGDGGGGGSSSTNTTTTTTTN